jgi:hypothetical protein
MILASLNFIDKLNELETCEQKEYKKETKQETQLPVSTNRASAPTNSLLVYSIIDFSNSFDNPNFVILLANYNFLDPFWLDQGISFSTL